MNPQLILSLWRERWGKADNLTSRHAYQDGAFNVWGKQFAASAVWGVPAMGVLVWLLCGLLFVFTVTVPLTPGGQVVLSLVLGAAALYLRRFSGTFVTLVVGGVSLLTSARYLFWRFSATLASDTPLDYFFGFGLCVAELYLCFMLVLRSIPVVFPMKRGFVPLPHEAPSWPTVDVFVPCDDLDAPAIEALSEAALALEWPQRKIKVYLLDDAHRGDAKALADAMGVSYLARPENVEGRAGCINHALQQSKGQLVMVFDKDTAPRKDFLLMSVGWFVQDQQLGVLQTVHHWLAPKPPANFSRLFHAPSVSGSCMLFRRSMLQEAQGIHTGPVTAQAHTALRLQALGYGHAYIGFQVPDAAESSDHQMSVLPPDVAASVPFRVDAPFLEQRLRRRLRVSFWIKMLRYFYPLPRLIFQAAPFSYLLGGIHIIQTSGDLFAAYAVPHLVLGLLAKSRVENPGWVTVSTYLQETALAWYMFLITALTLVGTELGRCLSRWSSPSAEKPAPFGTADALPFVAITGLNLTGLVVGCMDWSYVSPTAQGISTFYLLWISYNLLLLAARLAVAEEARHIQLHLRLQRHVSVTMRMSSGHSVRCVTENFPETELVLKLPSEASIAQEELLGVSIFHGVREYVFSAKLLTQQGTLVHVHVQDNLQNDYRWLAHTARSRGVNWPKWLPGRHADHPLPLWLVKPAMAMYAVARDFTFRQINKWK